MTASAPSTAPLDADDRLLATFIALGFVSVATFGVLHHEAWPAQLPWAAAIQAFDLVVAVTGVYLFVRYSPFTPIQKALFTLGYFPAYEYTAINGNHALGVLGVWACCAWATRRPIRLLPLAVTIALLTQVSAFAGIIGLSLAAALLADRLWQGTPADVLVSRGRFWLPALLCVAVVLVASLRLTAQPPDGGPAMHQYLSVNDMRVAGLSHAIPAALFPFRDLHYNWWVAHGPALRILRGAFAILAYGFVGVTAIGLLGRPKALVFFGLAIGGLLTFIHFSWPSGLDQDGHLYLALVAALWLGMSDEPVGRGGPAVRRAWGFVRGPGLTLLLIAQAVAGLQAISFERRYASSRAYSLGEPLAHPVHN